MPQYHSYYHLCSMNLQHKDYCRSSWTIFLEIKKNNRQTRSIRVTPHPTCLNGELWESWREIIFHCFCLCLCDTRDRAHACWGCGRIRGLFLFFSWCYPCLMHIHNGLKTAQTLCNRISPLFALIGISGTQIDIVGDMYGLLLFLVVL